MSNPSFGIPPAARKINPMHGLLVKVGEKDNRGYPVALDYFKVGRQSSGGFDEHPDFKGSKPRTLDIILFSDDMSECWRDSLAVYDGKQRFCYNNSAGDTAMRRRKDGGFSPCSCDPETCALYTGNTLEVLNEWEAAYPHAKLIIKGKETNCIKCKHNTYFYFSLPSPVAGEPSLTATGEVARLYTTSKNTAAQLMAGLIAIRKLTGGLLAGLKCTLKINMIRNTHGGLSPTVGIVGPTADELPQALFEMAKLRGSLDGDKAMRELAAMSDEERAKVDAEYIYTHFTRGADYELPEHDSAPLALPPSPDDAPVTFCTESPLVKALLKRLGYGSGVAGKLQMKYGEDEFSCVQELRQFADTAGTDISDLLKHFGGDIIDAEYEDIVTTTPKEAHLKSVNQANRGNPPASGSVSASQTESTDEGSPDIEMPPLFSDDPKELKE